MAVPHIRKTQVLKETLYAEMGRVAAKPVTRVAGVAILSNPSVGRFEEDLSPLFELGVHVGELLMPQMVALLPAAPRSYGKAAVVGIGGDPEHGAALIHPRLGATMRAAVGGGKAIIPSNVKVSSAGSSIDVPLAHKDEIWSFDELDTITVSLSDAPRPHEIMVVLALADGPRINARIGQGPAKTNI